MSATWEEKKSGQWWVDGGGGGGGGGLKLQKEEVKKHARAERAETTPLLDMPLKGKEHKEEHEEAAIRWYIEA